MGGVVVHHQVDIEVTGDIGFDLIEELAELACAVARKALTDDLACGDVEGCEQRGHAVALVVVAAPCRLTWPHGQHRLAAVERLDLGLFVHAQNQRMGRR